MQSSCIFLRVGQEAATGRDGARSATAAGGDSSVVPVGNHGDNVSTGYTLRPTNELAIKAGPFRVYDSITSAKRGRGGLRAWYGDAFEIWTCSVSKQKDSACTYVKLLECVA